MASAPRVLCCGLATHDHIFSVDRIPDRPTKYRAKAFAAAGGGTGATAAVAVARLGGDARLVSRLGDDAIGDAILGELEAYGVDCRLVRRFPGCTSSISAVIVDRDGERLILNHADESLPDEAGWIPELPAGSGAVLADVRWPAATVAVLTRARAAGVPGILDGDSPSATPAMVEAATIAAFSAAGLAGTTGEPDIARGLARAARIGDGVMMATDGANGVYWLEGPVLRHCPAFAVAAVDTLGAGDVFHGALALAIAEGAAIEPAVRFASAAAALKVTRFGGRAGAPTRGEVELFLETR